MQTVSLQALGGFCPEKSPSQEWRQRRRWRKHGLVCRVSLEAAVGLRRGCPLFFPGLEVLNGREGVRTFHYRSGVPGAGSASRHGVRAPHSRDLSLGRHLARWGVGLGGCTGAKPLHFRSVSLGGSFRNAQALRCGSILPRQA